MEEAINEAVSENTLSPELAADNSEAVELAEVSPEIKDAENGDGEEIFIHDAESDLSEIREMFPQLADVNELSEIENSERFVELRAMGLSVREALLATNGTAKARGSAYDNRSHLKSSVPKAGGSSGIQMSRAELQAARDLFGTLTEKEIKELYKRVRN